MMLFRVNEREKPRQIESLFHNFYVNALGQIGQGACRRARAYGLTENVEDSASRFSVFRFFEVRYDGGLFADGNRDFEGHLVVAVNQGLLHGVGIPVLDLVGHVANLCGHACEVHIGENDARSVRVPGDDFSVCIEPVSGAFAGGAAVERTVGFYTVECCLALYFARADAQCLGDVAPLQVESHGAVIAAYRERNVECDFLYLEFGGAAGTRRVLRA